jgi:hypothetical protein
MFSADGCPESRDSGVLSRNQGLRLDIGFWLSPSDATESRQIALTCFQSLVYIHPLGVTPLSRMSGLDPLQTQKGSKQDE